MSFITRELKPHFERSMSPLIELLSQKGISPNLITFTGLGLIALGSVALYLGATLPAVLLLGCGALLDAVDGALARKQGIVSDFGSFIDSTVDRVSDSLPFLALATHYGTQGQAEGVFLSFTSLIGSFGVSYTKAKAESLGVYGLGGIFERTERWIVLLIGIVGGLIPLALLVITVGAFATTIQRVMEVRKTLSRRLL